MTGDLKDIFPDFVLMAAAFGIPAKRVVRPEELRPAIQCGPYPTHRSGAEPYSPMPSCGARPPCHLSRRVVQQPHSRECCSVRGTCMLRCGLPVPACTHSLAQQCAPVHRACTPLFMGAACLHRSAGPGETVVTGPHAACREMLATEGPYLLDVMVPHIQHVLPMIPGGGSFKEVITTGDGLDTY